MAVPRRAESLIRSLAILAGAVLAGLAGLPAKPAVAADRPGEFDYWVLALSWSPQYCRGAPSNPQCTQPRGFVVHGLWPQYESGAPTYCGKRERVPDALVERMLPLMPDRELVQQQWRKHGSCSGLDMAEYFLNVERAWRRIVVPSRFDDSGDFYELSTPELERAFTDVNPGIGADAIALQCSGRWLREARFCFDREFQPRSCGEDVTDRCRGKTAVRPVRAQPQPLVR
ncbi:ribonuclease T [Fontimonas sp. SYSU GA230001]|uniref:ribonuclease T2 family protein n=1 Tax=Fontimonas sp. SYSU GA230001 TaxID=3142450 RepID=UPI0032B39E93